MKTPLGGAASDANNASPPTIESLQHELAALRAERDKAIAARDALVREVLPLAHGPLETQSKRGRHLAALFAIVVFGGLAGLLLQNWRALQELHQGRLRGQGSSSSVEKSRPAAPAEGTASASTPAGRRWEIFPVPELDLVGRAVLSPEGGVVVVAEAASKGRLARLDLASGGFTLLRGLGVPIRDLAFTADGHGLICGATDGSVSMVDASEGRVLRQVRAAGPPVWALAVSAQHLAIAGADNVIELVPLPSGPTRRLSAHQSWVRALAFDRSGALLASGGHDRNVHLWNLRTGQQRTLRGHRVWVSALAISTDGRRLASADWDGRVLLWDLSSGERLRELVRYHSRAVTALAFDHDGKHLASGSLDRTVVLWDLASGRPGQVLEGHRFAVTWVGFARARLISASGDGTVRSWPLPVQPPPVSVPLPPVQAGEVTLRNNTTGERARLRLFDAQRRPVPGAAERLAAFLRCGADDRTHAIDEDVLRLVDRIAEHFGRHREIVMISGYRSPEYNHLRTVQSRGVAKESQHMNGIAIDLRVAGVTITKLRDVVKSWRLGGVGFYPDSQFVHVDLGPVRTWTGD